MKWCFDTSALIEPWIRRYPPDMFGPVWKALEKLADDGVIGAPVDVLHELERQSDGLTAWAQARGALFIEADRKTTEHLKEIVNHFPGFMKPGSTKSGADPMVVAMAQSHGVPLVTYETMAKKTDAPKIPNVCAELGIEIVSIVEVLRGAGFKM